LGAPSCLCFVVEGEESEAILLARLFVGEDGSGQDFEAKGLDVFEQIQLVVVLGQVSYVDGGFLHARLLVSVSATAFALLLRGGLHHDLLTGQLLRGRGNLSLVVSLGGAGG